MVHPFETNATKRDIHQQVTNKRTGMSYIAEMFLFFSRLQPSKHIKNEVTNVGRSAAEENFAGTLEMKSEEFCFGELWIGSNSWWFNYISRLNSAEIWEWRCSQQTLPQFQWVVTCAKPLRTMNVQQDLLFMLWHCRMFDLDLQWDCDSSIKLPNKEAITPAI